MIFMETFKLKKHVWTTALVVVALCNANRLSGQSMSANNTSQFNWSNLPSIQEPVFPADTMDIRNFGAKGDGHTVNTKSINEAINASNKKGGGVVLIPAGYWMTGPIELKSNFIFALP